MTQKFEDILDNCLERILQKGETLEAVLKDYPAYARKLEPLLRAALLTSASAKAVPRPEFKKRALAEFRSAASAASSPRRRKPLFFWGWQRAWAVCAAVVLALVVATGSTVAASASSMPDQRLYPVKLASEQVQMVITPSPLGKAKLQARFAARRADELSYIVGRDGTEVVEQLSTRLTSHLGKMEDLVQGEWQRAREAEKPGSSGSTPGAVLPKQKAHPELHGTKAEDLKEIRKILNESGTKHETRLKEIESRIPVQAKPGIQRALDRSRQAYQKAIRVTGEDE